MMTDAVGQLTDGKDSPMPQIPCQYFQDTRPHLM